MWTIVWSDVSERDVQRIPWRIAARACAAAIHFAETGTGDLERVLPGDPGLLRVRARGAAALVRLDTSTRTVLVWRIYQTR
jgi:plasmid stabilization system protein ParE